MNFERGIDPRAAMGTGDVEFRKIEEQEEASRRMLEAAMAEAAIYDALHYLEKNLGIYQHLRTLKENNAF